jgi:pyrroloquinoline-quinone synthase
MNIKQNADALIEKWNLLTHPFYTAWSAGTLSTEALQQYATEYGNFIELLPLGWKTLNDIETEHEEEEHYDMWKQFAKSLQTEITPAQLAASKQLKETAKELFSRPASAIGAMYAFEVQQPATASSKLSGLQSHYAHLHADEAYFEVHSHNEHESEKLLVLWEKLSPQESEIALDACEKMSQALWNTLTDIHSH